MQKITEILKTLQNEREIDPIHLSVKELKDLIKAAEYLITLSPDEREKLHEGYTK